MTKLRLIPKEFKVEDFYYIYTCVEWKDPEGRLYKREIIDRKRKR